MGKMIDAQSIVVAAVATQARSQESGVRSHPSPDSYSLTPDSCSLTPAPEGAILRFVFWHSLALAILMGLLVTAQAYWWTGMIP